MARREDRIAEAAKEAGPATLAIRCDVTDPTSCRRAIEDAAAALGGIDAIVYTPALGPLGRLADADPDIWRRTFETNVIGASTFTAAAIPFLTESRGRAVYLTSVSASETPPWPGLGVYLVTKAALNKLVEAWGAEHPAVGFTRVVVGDCAGGEGHGTTEFPSEWDSKLAAELFPVWVERGLVAGNLVDVEEVVRVVDAVLRAGPTASIPSVIVTPRR